MNLFLERDPSDGSCTEGTLYLDGPQECFTLELPWKDNQRKLSCIPAGGYRIVLQKSARFERIIPHLLGVRDRDDILIHWGNSAQDTEGCILVGLSKGFKHIEHSKAAFESLLRKLTAAWDRKEAIFITVQDPVTPSTI